MTGGASRTSPSRRVLGAAATVVLVAGVLFPLYWGVRTSFTTGQDLSVVPTRVTLDNYRHVLVDGNFANALLNSLIVAVGAVVVTVPVALLAAYALARLHFPGRRFSGAVLALPLLPAVAVLVPLIVYLRTVGLYDTLYAVVLGAVVISLPFVVWMIRGFIVAVPVEIEESSYLDGCGRLGSLRRVVLPLVAPGLVTAAVFVFITAWNNYLLSVAFTTSPKLQVAPVAILGFIGAWGTDYPGMDAAATLALLPPLAFFLLVQRWFVQGVLAGSGR